MHTGLLDEAAHRRASEVAEAIRKRGIVRAEHTREVVRTDIPDDLKAAFVEACTTVATLQIRVAQLEGRVDDLKTALRALLEQAQDSERAA